MRLITQFNTRSAQKRSLTALDAVRQSPHLSRDIGVVPSLPARKIQQVQW